MTYFKIEFEQELISLLVKHGIHKDITLPPQMLAGSLCATLANIYQQSSLLREIEKRIASCQATKPQ